MTPLRQRMIRELELHRKSPATIRHYVGAVAQHYGRSPDKLAIEEVRDYPHHRITERKLAFSSCNARLAAFRFLYRKVLGRDDFDLRVPAKRCVIRSPLTCSKTAPSCRPSRPCWDTAVWPPPARTCTWSPYATIEPQPETLAQSIRHLLGIDITRCPRCRDVPRSEELRPSGATTTRRVQPIALPVQPWDTS